MLKRDLLAKSLLGGVGNTSYDITISYTNKTFTMKCDITTLEGKRFAGEYRLVANVDSLNDTRAADMSYFEASIQYWDELTISNDYLIDLCYVPCGIVSTITNNEDWVDNVIDHGNNSDCTKFAMSLVNVGATPGEIIPVIALDESAVRGFLKFVEITVGSPEAFNGSWKGTI